MTGASGASGEEAWRGATSARKVRTYTAGAAGRWQALGGCAVLLLLTIAPPSPFPLLRLFLLFLQSGTEVVSVGRSRQPWRRSCFLSFFGCPAASSSRLRHIPRPCHLRPSSPSLAGWRTHVLAAFLAEAAHGTPRTLPYLPAATAGPMSLSVFAVAPLALDGQPPPSPPPALQPADRASSRCCLNSRPVSPPLPLASGFFGKSVASPLFPSSLSRFLRERSSISDKLGGR